MNKSLFDNNENDDNPQPAFDEVPSFSTVIKLLQDEQGICLDNNQEMAYEVTCSTFLLKLIHNSGSLDQAEDNENRGALTKVTKTKNKDLQCQRDNVIRRLRAYGGQTQLFLLLNGPDGAGKTTAVHPAEQFCMQFCKFSNILWMNNLCYMLGPIGPCTGWDNCIAGTAEY